MIRAAVILAFVGGVAVLWTQGPALAQSSPSFEVASVKRLDQPIPLSPPQRTPPRSNSFYRAIATVASLIQFAYNVRDFQLFGGPDWVRKDRFEVNARSAAELSSDEKRPMVQSLLKDRFKLVIRTEQREMPFSALVIARSDGRLGPTLTKCGDAENPPVSKPVRVPPGGEALSFRCVAMSTVVNVAAGILRRPVIDKTGLTGMWNYQLAYGQVRELPPGRERDLAEQENPPSFETALQEQLGLKLESGRGPVDVLVIDSVEMPTPD